MKDNINVEQNEPNGEEQTEKKEYWSTKYCSHCHKKFHYSGRMIERRRDSFYGMISSVRCTHCGRLNSVR